MKGQHIVEDHLGRKVEVPLLPQRIVSLVPSQTELLFHLGLDVEIVGRTKFCVHPGSQVARVSKIGGTKKIRIEAIRDLNPDLIIGNKEENTKEIVESLEKEFPVWMSDIYSFEDALKMIRDVGDLVRRREIANYLSHDIKVRFNQLNFETKYRAVYLIWREPYMIAAGNTFINEMLGRAGYKNVFDDMERYPEVTMEDIKARKPEVILLSSEPFPFGESHFEEFQKQIPRAKIHVVDGELFSWYGSRLLKSPHYFEALHDFWAPNY